VPEGQKRGAVITRFLGQGAATAVIGALTISSMVGFGTVVEKLHIFADITKAIAGLPPMPPILTFGLAVLIIVGITASAPASVVIALSALAIPFFQAGVSPAAMHRVGSLASAVFDTLPIGGSVMMMLGLAGLTHREGYKPIFFVTVFLTGVATFVAIALYLIWPNLI
jgi:H+/gluconate symporter-like permease